MNFCVWLSNGIMLARLGGKDLVGGASDYS